ncbi:glycosyltransferase family 4 protein [Novosphingobium lentum]|uniref:glycosyltransferase family 4 protein n=1 Tax=Novosphingobium lentum TaxID=145287 RepID=UPI001FE0DD54|nr:glycosyltransferase family 1 protein [Novosphingobium lentum]
MAVDALGPELTGVGRYCWELTSRLPHFSGVESMSFWRGFDAVPDPACLLQPASSSGRRKFGWRRRAKRVAVRLGLRSRTADWPKMAGIDVFHGPNFMLPPWVERGVMTIHDLSVFRYPETHPPARIAAYEREFQSSLGRCTHIITPTQTVCDEVMAFTGMGAHMVSAVHMGVGGHFEPWPAARRNPVLTRLGLPATGYGLTISALEPRKRIDRLLEAWRGLDPALRRTVPLVIAGASGWNNDGLRGAIASAASEGWVIPLGYVAEGDLPAIYSGATLFIYPSLYEGFGLPPIEAMASGVPTIVANTSCLPEVTGGAAMLVDPDDRAGFTTALERGMLDEAWRSGAILRGLAVASAYSWEECVEKTLEVYRRSVA